MPARKVRSDIISITTGKKRILLQHWALALAIIAMIGIHFWRIGQVPQGLFADETSIGYNAYLIASTYKNEHGQFLPLFFSAFGDYRSPLFIYGAAMVFAAVGSSTAALRATGVLFYTVTLVSLVCLTMTFSKKRSVAFYMVFAAGLVPWLFTVSRIGFEVASFPPMVALSLLAVAQLWKHVSRHSAYPYAMLGGFCIAMTLYTYGTSRVLGFVMIATLAVMLAWHRQWRTALLSVAAFAVTAMPYMVYGILHPAHLTVRFRSMTYVYDHTLYFWQKVSMFFWNYIAHFSPDFLLLHGDLNTRHATGVGGEVYWIIVILCFAGIGWFLGTKRLRQDPFLQFTFIGLLFSPVGSALTTDSIPHAFRSIPMVLYMLLFSVVGLSQLLAAVASRWRIIMIIVLTILFAEATVFLYDYFSERYAVASRKVFETYGMEESLAQARTLGPDAVIISPSINYTAVKFFSITQRVPRIMHGEQLPRMGNCYLFRAHESPKWENSALRSVDIGSAGAMIRGRCFLP
ncbi:hypothetical protein EXS70_00760 [Candidatus Peribacteria bacterium]|nr:hypothetical protein [Candidatus Peribacteria bacterium]